jgi:hypothetical protein
MSRTIRVLVVRPGCEPVAEPIGDSLESFRAVLGCKTVQCVPIGHGYEVWLDDDGLANGKPQNGCGFLGTYFFARSNEGEDVAGLTDDQLQECLAYWRSNRNVVHAGGVFSTASFATFDELTAVIEQRVADRDQHFAESVRRGRAADVKDNPKDREDPAARC